MRTTALLPLFLFPTLLQCAPQDPSGVEAKDFRTWVRECSVELESLDWKATDPASFHFLDEALEGKRVVYIGEMDHFVAERMECRLVLIQELVRRGYRRIGMEMGLSDSRRMDRYLETGDEAWLDQVALYGYRGDLREDRQDEVAGWTDDEETEFKKTMLDEAEWFLRQLRKINEELPEGEPRVKWFGYDLSFRPGGGYADATLLLAPHLENSVVLEVKKQMTRVPGESRIEEAERLEALVDYIDGNAAVLTELLGPTGKLDLRRAFSRMADSFRLIEEFQELGNFDPEKVAAALATRERRMDHNFEEHLAEWPPDEKLILLGHALHLSKDSEQIETAGFGRMWKSIGTYLAERLPGEVYAFWMLHDRGRHGVPRAEPPVLRFRSPRDSVERELARIHPILLLPLGSGDAREAWLDVERILNHSGSPAKMVVPDQADCLFFVKEAHEPGVRAGASGG